MNAMYFVPPSVEEIDTTAAAMWGWDNMRRTQQSQTRIFEALWISNPMQVTRKGWPYVGSIVSINIMINIVANWTMSLNAGGVHTLTTLNGGSTIGGFISPSSINATNWTPPYWKSAYIDSLPRHSNLHILADTTVTCVVFGTDKDQNGNLYSKELGCQWVPKGA
ncbi:hypothetical protein BJ165DRAFT_1409451 [Panaeolus papilionaceus]|nr:hypothetical protein BJ165DRAFT_1409451 [Panaeolus papilionaceus]